MVESRERPVLEALAGRAAIGDKRVGSGRWHDGVREALRDQQRCRDWVIRDILCESAASDALVFVAKGRPRKRLSAPRSVVDFPLERIRTGLRSGVRLQSASGRNASSKLTSRQKEAVREGNMWPKPKSELRAGVLRPPR